MAPVCEAIEPVVRNTLNFVSKDAEVVFDPPLKGPNVRGSPPSAITTTTSRQVGQSVWSSII